MSIEFIISFSLTLLIFSYLLGDNWLYRWSISIFVGLSAAYTTIVTFQSVIYPTLQPLIDGTWGIFDASTILLIYVPLILGILLLLKPFRALRPLTNIALAFMIAVGAAVAVIGAISGTIIPVISTTAAINSDSPNNLLNSIILVVGVISSLLYFQYGARRNQDGEIKRGRIVGVFAVIGEGFIVVTLGAIYGAAILTSLTILTGQLANLAGFF